MNGKNHLITGLLTSIVVYTILLVLLKQTPSISEFLLVLLVGGVFGVLPDIDHKMAHITWNLLGLGLILNIWGQIEKSKWAVYGLILTSIVYCTARFLKHRGITHRWWFILCQALLIYPVFQSLTLSVVALCAGLSHLWGDKYFKN